MAAVRLVWNGTSPLTTLTDWPWAAAHASSRGRSPTPLEPASGAMATVLSTPAAWPDALRKPEPESPGMPGVAVYTSVLQPPGERETTLPCFGLRNVTPPRSSELPYEYVSEPVSPSL